METANMNTYALRIYSAMMFALALASVPATAHNKYDTGATDTEIKIGNIMPYTGLFSEYGAVGRAEAAYFQMINDRGGVNGRKINFINGLFRAVGVLTPIAKTCSPERRSL
jgi:branched-chain amino acid transport system substrate-binding protein